MFLASSIPPPFLPPIPPIPTPSHLPSPPYMGPPILSFGSMGSGVPPVSSVLLGVQADREAFLGQLADIGTPLALSDSWPLRVPLPETISPEIVPVHAGM